MSCDAIRGRLARLGDSTARAADDPDGIVGLLAHARGCASCREALDRAIGESPELLFVLSASEESAAAAAPEPDWRGFNARVLAGIEAARKRGWRARFSDWALAGPFPVASLVPAGAVAVAALLALTLFWPGRTGPAAPASPLTASAVQTVETAAVPAEDVGIAGESNPDSPASDPAPVETVSSATARIVQMDLDREGDESAAGDFVLIVDEEMNL